VLGSIGAGLLLVKAAPLDSARRPSGETWVRVEVTALGQRNEQSQATEVWAYGLFLPDGSQAPLRPEPLSGRWEEKEAGVWFSFGQPEATLRWEGRLARGSQLRLLRHSWSGHARVTVNGRAQEVDLYASGSDLWRQEVAPEAAAAGRFQRRLLRVTDALGLGLLLLMLGLGLATWPGPSRAQPPKRWESWGLAALCMAAWGGYLLAFWPALMTSDSLDQWGQAIWGPIINHHPAFHTLLLRGVTRVWASPAAVALVQMAAMSLAAAGLLSELGAWGVPRPVRWALALVFALSPVNGVMVVTLWKDIAYTIVVLALTALLLRVARTRGEALRSRPLFLGLLASMASAALLRLNGLPMVALLLGTLFVVCQRELRRRVVWLGAGVAVAWFLVVVPVYRAAGVRPMPGASAHSLQIHHMAALAHHVPEAFTPEDKQVLEKAAPWEEWHERYNCFTVDSLLYNKKLKRDFFESADKVAFQRLWLRQAWAHPEVIASHLECVSSQVWRILQPPRGYQYLFNDEIVPNELGLAQAPQWPAAHQWLLSRLKHLTDPQPRWWVWRPALYLYVGLFCAIVAAARLRSAWVLLAAMPVVLNALVLLGISIAQDFRYLYPCYVFGLLSPALLFVRRE
jgi:hypothetical protein